LAQEERLNPKAILKLGKNASSLQHRGFFVTHSFRRDC